MRTLHMLWQLIQMINILGVIPQKKVSGSKKNQKYCGRNIIEHVYMF